MRSTCLLLTGLALAGAGVAVLASDPARVWLGALLIVAGVLVKVGGFLVTEGPIAPRPNRGPNHRTVTTLDGQRADLPRAGVPGGRSAPIRRRRRSAPARPAPAASLPQARRRAS